jgi:diguanylate cyclase (GGDEF)-like protein
MQTILVVNVGNDFLSDLTRLFKRDVTILPADNEEQALKQAIDEDVDLILASDETNAVNIISFCERLKQNQVTRNIPFIAMPEEVDRHNEEKTLALGAMDYFSSSTPMSVVFYRITNHLNGVRKFKELELIACTDGLTGLTNKMQFTTVFNKEWHAAIRGRYSLAAIMIDIDEFKLYNDEFGHIEGDECLKKIAREVDDARRRESDIASRFGGEEFVLLLPFSDLKGAHQIADMLLNSVRALEIPHATSASHPIVTVSAGVAACMPNHHDIHITPDTLLEQADMKLYEAKHSGRNRYV